MIHYVKGKKEPLEDDSLCALIKDVAKSFRDEVEGYDVTVRLDTFKFTVRGRLPIFVGNDEGAGKHYFDLMEEGSWFMVRDDKYPKDEENCYNIWTMACILVGPQFYNALYCNCEHFVTLLMKKKANSEQVDKACLCAIVVGACVCVVGAILYLQYGFCVTGFVMGATGAALGLTGAALHSYFGLFTQKPKSE